MEHYLKGKSKNKNNNTDDKDNIELVLKNKALIDDFVKFLQHDNNQHKVNFSDDELDQGTLIHCMIVACIKMQYIEAEKQAIKEDEKEDMLEIMSDYKERMKLHLQKHMIYDMAFRQLVLKQMKELEQQIDKSTTHHHLHVFDPAQIDDVLKYIQSNAGSHARDFIKQPLHDKKTTRP